MFSVIIPLYNKQNSITATIQTVLTQNYKNFEIIVVDDGSTDESVLKVLKIQDNRIRLIQKSNKGVSSARNIGIAEAKYRYIALLDADDIWEPEYLSEQKSLIDDFPDARMWGCGWGYLENSKKSEIPHGIPLGFRGKIEDYFGMKKKSMVFWTSSVVIDKLIFEEIQAFDDHMKIGEDWDVWFRIILQYEAVFYNKTLSYYRQDSENRECKRKIPITDRMPYYIEKYENFRQFNKSFRKWFDYHTALVMQDHYFVEKDKRAEVVLKKLDYSLLPNIFILLYKTPFIIGLSIFNIRKIGQYFYRLLKKSI